MLTSLGRHLARLPVGNVKLGKMLLLGAMLGCVEPVVKIAALLSGRTPFLSPADARDEASKAKKQVHA